MQTRLKILQILLGIFIFLFSCKKKEDTMWEVALLTPVVTGQLSILDILPDSISEVQSDGGVDIVFRETLFQYNFADENISIPDTIVETFVSLDSLQLTDRVLSQSISLGDVAIALGFPVGTFIILSNGSEVAIDPIADLSSGEQPIDATSFFESATVESGFLDIEVENGFPIPLANINLEIRNESDGEVIVSEFVAYIEPGETFLSTTPLDGKTVDGNLVAEITDFNSPGSSGEEVLIDTSDALIITMKAYDLSLLEATAIFPAQNLVNNQSNVLYDMGGPEFTEMKIKSGEVIMYIVNTIQDSIHIEYNIPGAVDEFGNSIGINTVVPPAPPDGSVVIDEVFPLEGYTIDLRGASGVSYNTFYNEFIARIDSTGEVVTISKDDSIQVIYGLQNIIPLELKGYFGQTELSEKDTIRDLDSFNSITGGTIDLSDCFVDIVVSNGVGIEGDITIKNLTSINPTLGTQESLIASEYVNVPTAVNRAIDNPFTPGYTVFNLNSDNSNIVELFEVMPTSLIYDTEMSINPNGNNFNYQDFLLEESSIDLFLDMRIPLNFIAEELMLENVFDSQLADIKNKEDIVDGTFTLHAENGFPFEAGIYVEFLSWNDEVLFTADLATTPVAAASLNSDCKVTESRFTELNVVINAVEMQEILDADKIRVKSVFSTESLPPCPENIRIYSDYYLKFTLSADFNYIVNLNN